MAVGDIDNCFKEISDLVSASDLGNSDLFEASVYICYIYNNTIKYT